MKSLYNFIIKPLTTRYDNIRKVGDKTLIINTTIENHRFVSKQAVVVSVPAAYNSHIKQGDNLYVHHNIFRRWYDQKGKERNSSMHFKDDLYFCSPDQIYMYNDKPHGHYCFVKPILNKDYLSIDKEQYTTKEIINLKIDISSKPLLKISEESFYNYVVKKIIINSG